MIQYVHLSELGDGWAPAYLETEGEMAFIREAHKGLSDVNSYWISGYTDWHPDQPVPYSKYYTTGSGNCSICYFDYIKSVI